jgi:hypothetical protein
MGSLAVTWRGRKRKLRVIRATSYFLFVLTHGSSFLLLVLGSLFAIMGLAMLVLTLWQMPPLVRVLVGVLTMVCATLTLVGVWQLMKSWGILGAPPIEA